MDLKKEYCRYCGADITSTGINILAHPFKGDEFIACPCCGKKIIRPLKIGDWSWWSWEAVFCIIGSIALVLFALIFVIFGKYFLK